MEDRQQFQHYPLANGINLYTYQHPFPVCCLELLLPVGAGHAHAGNNFLPGSPHFLEHLHLIRSSRYPEAYSLDREIGLKSGHSNGTTYPTTTHYEIDVPSQELEWACDALIDRVFHPLFDAEDVKTECGVIRNEREQRKFYPGRSRVSQYYHTQFLSDVEYPLEQLFGSDEDLRHITPQTLQEMHRRLTSAKDISVLAVGPSDFSLLRDALSGLPTENQEFTLSTAPVTWENPDFRTEYFDTVGQPTLEVAWVHPRLSYEDFRAVSFIISLLTNSTHGTLYRELREEKGWTYGIDGFCQQRNQNTICGLSFPLNTIEQVDFVREVLAERIQTAIKDQTLVENEIRRYIGSQIYGYQTASDIISGASYDLITHGRIYSETEWLAAIERLRNPAYRQQIADRYFSVEHMGQMLFMPERRTLVPKRELQHDR